MRSILLALLAVPTFAAEPVVFVSAFASGEKAGIHAFGFDTEKGTLKPLIRVTGVQNPFFIALSPDRRFLSPPTSKKATKAPRSAISRTSRIASARRLP